jgi:hypothetical protein
VTQKNFIKIDDVDSMHLGDTSLRLCEFTGY